MARHTVSERDQYSREPKPMVKQRIGLGAFHDARAYDHTAANANEDAVSDQRPQRAAADAQRERGRAFRDDTSAPEADRHSGTSSGRPRRSARGRPQPADL